jgi:hypothetical protein
LQVVELEKAVKQAGENNTAAAAEGSRPVAIGEPGLFTAK